VFDLVLVGYGNVAKRFVALLEEHAGALDADHDVKASVIGVVTRRDGPRYLVDRFGRTRATSSLGFIREVCRRDRAAAREGRLVVVETTTLDVDRGQPAIDHVRAALDPGCHVVTAPTAPDGRT
jgi:homoserine dehydrogenase